MNNTELAWAVLVEPRRAFTSLRERPRYWFPFLSIVLLSAAIYFWFYNIVDVEWLGHQVANTSLPADKGTDAERATFAASLTKNVMMWSAIAVIVLGIPVLRWLESAFYSLAARASNVPLSFSHWMSLSCWSAWPFILTTLLMAVPLFGPGNLQITPEALSLLSLNEVLFHVSADNRWHTLLSTLTILHPWAWWLTALGVRTWTARSWAFSATLALVPPLLVYGIWTLIVLASA